MEILTALYWSEIKNITKKKISESSISWKRNMDGARGRKYGVLSVARTHDLVVIDLAR